MQPRIAMCSSIEWVWSVVRRNYNRRVTKCALRRDYGQADVVNCAMLACEEVRPDVL